ncbi:PPR repeat family [Microdochium nivale]|nr:PPR repeat family [Microdochium nivale]
MLAFATRWQHVVCSSVTSTRSTTTRTFRAITRHNVAWSSRNARGFSSQLGKTESAKTSISAKSGHARGTPKPDGENKTKNLALPWMIKTEDGTPAAPDPLRAAQHVSQLLAKNKIDDARAFTRAASKQAQVVVSWNHLIDHALKDQKLREALKIFQEMKKRGQLPNAQTFTILFRGFALSRHPKTAVSEAVKLYQSMLTRERVQPNVIHLNAVLKVCAAAGDLGSLFTIVESANDSNLRSANSQTYTIILNGLRAPLMARRRPNQEDEQLAIADDTAVQEALHRAKTIWQEIITRWRTGAVVIDEGLVCSMGRLLMLGDRADQRAVVDMIKQTMQVFSHTSQQAQPTVRNVPSVEKPASSSTNAVVPAQANPARNSLAKAAGYAKPGNNSLSLVLESLTETNQTSQALDFWDSFVNQHRVVPDVQNWTALHRAFSTGRNSNNAANAIGKMPQDMVQVKHIRIAMKTCLRDNLNQHAFDNATRILKLMETQPSMPDANTMQIYLQVAYACNRQFQSAPGIFDERGKYAHGKQLSAALNNLKPPHETLRKHIEGLQLDKITDSKEWLQKAAVLGDLVALSRKMIATYDRLIFENMVPVGVAELLKPIRNHLNRIVVAYFDERLKRDPGFDRKAIENEEANTETFRPRQQVSQRTEEVGPEESGYASRQGKYYSGMHRMSFGQPEISSEDEAGEVRTPYNEMAHDDFEIEAARRPTRSDRQGHARKPRVRSYAPRDGQVKTKEDFWAVTD